MNLKDRVRAAHADAWAAEGRARAPLGGGAHRVRGARAMASATAFQDEPDTLVHVHIGPGDDTDDLDGLGFVEVAGLVVRSVSDGT